MKNLVVSLVLALLFGFFVFANFNPAISAGPQTELTNIQLDIPNCKTITVKITDLRLVSFKVDGQNIYRNAFYSATEMPRKVELKVRGNGAINLQTDRGYQWIAIIIDGQVFSLPQPPAIPTCADECVLGSKQCTEKGFRICGNYDPDDCLEWSKPFQCSEGSTCLGGWKCVATPKEDVVNNISSAYTKTAEGYTGECSFVVKTSRPFSYISISLNGENAKIEKVNIEAAGSLVLYSFPKQNGAIISLNNSGFVEEEIKVTIRATDGPSDIVISVNGVAWAGCGYQQVKPGDAMGAPTSNPPEGKSRLPFTWGGVKTK